MRRSTVIRAGRVAIYQSRRLDVCDEVGGLRWHRLSRSGRQRSRSSPPIPPMCWRSGPSQSTRPSLTPNHPFDFKFGRSFFATELRRKWHARGHPGNRDRRHPQIAPSRSEEPGRAFIDRLGLIWSPTKTMGPRSNNERRTHEHLIVHLQPNTCAASKSGNNRALP